MRWPVLFIGIVLVAGVVVFALSYGSPSTSSVATTTQEIIPGVPEFAYQNAEYGFSIRRPTTTNQLAENFDGYLPVTGTPLVGFSLPAMLYAGTNLVDAGVYIGVSNTADVASACTTPKGNEKSLGTRLLGGTIFSMFNSVGAAAGNTYEATTYRTVRNGGCFEIVELLHSGNIGNYPAGQVKQFDHDTFSGILDRMVQTFAFTAKAGSGVQGAVSIHCASGATDTACAQHVFTIQAYQGISAVGLFKTADDGTFRSELPPGQYELRVDTSSSTHCASVGVVIPEDAYISTDISCEVGVVE